MQLARRAPWLLFSDIHFRHLDLDRIQKTADWITALTRQRRIQRVVICGDLLKDRSKLSTNVLSACYRFLNELSEAGPHIHIILGNHDLAYKNDYHTTVLEALRASRLSPFVSVHSDVATAEWDDRRVLLLPFRENQNDLVNAVDALDSKTARQTVAFAHLAINGAITQRHVVGGTNSITYRGLTGPDRFASLARTFTGHFHSHQTITPQARRNSGGHCDPLQGSIIYLGSPLQLTWNDLHDEKRGVVLLDPDTLQHELIVSPFGVGYTTIDSGIVLRGEADPDAIKSKHVMLTGDLSRYTYVTARDRLLAEGARSVRNWNPLGPALRDQPYARGGLGSTVLDSDVVLEEAAAAPRAESVPSAQTTAAILGVELPPPPPQLDLSAEAREYVSLLDLESPLRERREALIDVGRRLVGITGQTEEESDGGKSSICYESLFKAEVVEPDWVDRETGTDALPQPKVAETSLATHIFVAKLRSLTITNFLGIQGRLRLDLGRNVPRGLVFLSGENGSGKSTIIEAMTWCQFGRCIRGGMAANDVVNDAVGRDCSVELAFDNGYTITRHRKSRTHGNRVLVSLHGVVQTQFEHGHSRDTQAAIGELLGIDFDTYARTVVLGHESTTGFLNASGAQRRDLIETALELSSLDRCSAVSRDLLKDMDADIAEVQVKLRSLMQTKKYAQDRLQGLQKKQEFLIQGLESATGAAAASLKELGNQKVADEKDDTSPELLSLDSEYYELRTQISALDDQMATVTRKESEALAQVRLADAYAAFRKRKADLLSQLHNGELRLDRLQSSFALLRDQNTEKVANDFGVEQEDLDKVVQDQAAEKLDRDALWREVTELQQNRQELQQRYKTSRLQYEEWSLKTTAYEQARKLMKAKQQEAEMYAHLVETEEGELVSLGVQQVKMGVQMADLESNRELLAFWVSTLAKKTYRTTTSSPDSKGKGRKGEKGSTRTTFREYLLDKSLDELNGLMAQVLTVLYDDANYAKATATGLLRSLLTDGDERLVLLDRTLQVGGGSSVAGLAYGKRSSGERKRLDLALFFALVQLGQAHSRHRAHYLLVDEVFDSLDTAGQAAVVRWCSLMEARVDLVLILTHSPFLVQDGDLSESAGGAGGAVAMMTARGGSRGTELLMNGRQIGRETG
ncbi:gp46 recombination endonuclease subunit [Grosmannia clavigera kw1407]|uniref:Gp46 recombination endonuclease subunit n=1 Tax=Grosmannia clavigera (strain kw1407 / UAMH 11150) TaxID=655863 RepID=F0XEE6_GROCL|nr:gp46 recombination endonuclease subunit [Grosmannia clavigera kw1407]EFX03530.1 gp46 recombination endonuclease subunit [Grosmannia clavigera kw1407]